MTKSRKKPKDRRLEISETASSAGTGPVDFDLEHARAWGWAERDIADVWSVIFPLVLKVGNRAKRRHPELYAKHPKNGDIIFVGAIHDSEAWSDAKIRRAGLVRLGAKS